MITAFFPNRENGVILVETANVDVFWSYIYKKEMVEFDTLYAKPSRLLLLAAVWQNLIEV